MSNESFFDRLKAIRAPEEAAKQEQERLLTLQEWEEQEHLKWLQKKEKEAEKERRLDQVEALYKATFFPQILWDLGFYLRQSGEPTASAMAVWIGYNAESVAIVDFRIVDDEEYETRFGKYKGIEMRIDHNETLSLHNKVWMTGYGESKKVVRLQRGDWGYNGYAEYQEVVRLERNEWVGNRRAQEDAFLKAYESAPPIPREHHESPLPKDWVTRLGW